MAARWRRGNRTGRRAALAVALLGLSLGASASLATVQLTRVSTDPFTNGTSQHRTEVEPDTDASGHTVVSVFQVGRFTDGGSSDIGWATSQDDGVTWRHGYLPGITTFAGAGPHDRVSDPSIAYDARHATWLALSLAMDGAAGVAPVVNRSTDGGVTWSKPVTVFSGPNLDKTWIACDAWALSPHYGNCYVEWDDVNAGNEVLMSTSSDGGRTWSAAQAPANHPSGLGGQPVVQPSGVVVVPFSGNFADIEVFRSLDGGATWTASQTISQATDHAVAGDLRTEPLPSADVDLKGRVYVVWQDCRFRAQCASNDIVMTTSLDGVTWTPITRIPIDAVDSSVDHFIPGIAADHATKGRRAHLALTYYYYPSAACGGGCQLDAGIVTSRTAGRTWSAPTQLAGPMQLTWLPDTTQGRMVGDYISTSILNGRAQTVVAAANAPSETTFDEAMDAPTGGLAVTGGRAPATDTTPAGGGVAGAAAATAR
jgi:hypothetical protein